MKNISRCLLLAATAMAAGCGDKVTIAAPSTSGPSTTTSVHAVTVTPSFATLNSGDKITFAVSVDADPGVTDRTVTWSSSNSAIASADQNGVITGGTTAGVATITATSKADPRIRGAALVTVVAAGAGGPATVTISSINGTYSAGGPATTNSCNFNGSVDVTLNVDVAGSGAGTATVTHKSAGNAVINETVSCTASGQTVSCTGSGTYTGNGTTYSVTDVFTESNNALSDLETFSGPAPCKTTYAITGTK
jgi:uncharacterized protein YjdB